MTTPNRVVLLACGSFNPLTNMHLRMFELAKDALNRTGKYKVIGGIISPVSDGYQKKDLVSAKHRCAMIRLGVKTSDWIRLDTWESEQETWTRTVHVLKHHQNVLDSLCNANTLHDLGRKKRKLDVDDVDFSNPYNANFLDLGNGPVEVKLLCGADMLETFGSPGVWADEDIEEIIDKYGLMCISRAGTNPEKFIYEHDLLTKFQDNICLVRDWIYNEISATKIRRALKRGESVRYLLQDPIIDYIKTHNLYEGENKYLNYITPSPNREEPDSRCMRDAMFLSTSHSAENTRHSLHVTRYHRQLSVDNIDYASPTGRRRSFRRRKECNYDEEYKRREYRSDDSFDSLDSLPRTPRKSVSCVGTDIAGLVRRVRGLRMTITPETCV